MRMIQTYTATGWDVLERNDGFWAEFSAPTDTYQLLKFSVLMGLMPFSGYMVYYTVIGKIWSLWPWIQTTVPVMRGLMCAVLQWVFFATLPILSSLLLDFFSPRKHKPDIHACTVVVTYSMTPLYPAALFVGIHGLNRVLPILALATFLYLLFFGFRIYLRQNPVRASVFTAVTFTLFAAIRQAFIFVIGY